MFGTYKFRVHSSILCWYSVGLLNYCHLQQSWWSHDFDVFSNIQWQDFCKPFLTMTPYFYMILYFTVIYSLNSRAPHTFLFNLVGICKISLDLAILVCANNISRTNSHKNNQIIRVLQNVANMVCESAPWKLGWWLGCRNSHRKWGNVPLSCMPQWWSQDSQLLIGQLLHGAPSHTIF